ncbi:Glutaredoxin [Fusarium equiseti]|uniref:Glutaredoxin n=1 Tax=Fusarium equiseti TaxID=61235 RepID=A0ABQ8R831_FUSEQ|nr:Glutaredoxin [Fusarium equiseti]
MSKAAEQIHQIINDNNIVVFSKSYCPYCRQTKKILDDLNTVYELLELDQLPEGSVLHDALEQISGQRTVPNIYIKQRHIGGNSDVQNLRSAGKLVNLIKDAGAVKA